MSNQQNKKLSPEDLIDTVFTEHTTANAEVAVEQPTNDNADASDYIAQRFGRIFGASDPHNVPAGYIRPSSKRVEEVTEPDRSGEIGRDGEDRTVVDRPETQAERTARLGLAALTSSPDSVGRIKASDLEPTPKQPQSPASLEAYTHNISRNDK